MIDTLKLGFEKCEVRRDAEIQIIKPPVKLTGQTTEGSALFRTVNGWQFGMKAYINTSEFNLTFHSMRGKPYAFIQFSVPKVLYGRNMGEVDRQGLNVALEQVESELFDLGVYVSLKDAYLSRVDLFKDAETERPFAEYAPLFDLLELSRKQKREYGTTFLFSNTQEEVCIYDKNEEVRIKAKKAREPIPELTGNRIRCENRLMSKAKIEAALQISTAQGLLRHFDYLEEFYAANVEKYIFRKDISALPLPFQVEPDTGKSKGHKKQSYDKNLLKAYIAKDGDQKAYLNRVQGIVDRSTYLRTERDIRTTAAASGEVESRFLELKAKLIG